jgi:hypothetical protein
MKKPLMELFLFFLPKSRLNQDKKKPCDKHGTGISSRKKYMPVSLFPNNQSQV